MVVAMFETMEMVPSALANPSITSGLQIAPAANNRAHKLISRFMDLTQQRLLPLLLAHDGDREAFLAQLDGAQDLGAVAGVPPLLVADAAHHQEVHLPADRGADLAAAIDHQLLALA